MRSVWSDMHFEQYDRGHLHTKSSSISSLFDIQDANASTDGNSTAGNSTAAAPPATKVVQRERKRVIRVPLAVGGAGYAFPGLSADQMKVCLFQNLTHRLRLARPDQEICKLCFVHASCNITMQSA